MPTPFLVLQCAALPFRLEKGKLEVLLVTSSRTHRWIIPKGHVEPMMTPQQSASVEAFEEAGVYGEVLPSPIGTWGYSKRGSIFRVEVFPMIVEQTLERWPEMWDRRRKWLSVEEAAKRVDGADLKALILSLSEFLECHRYDPVADVI